MTTPTFSDLANRFRNFNFDTAEAPDSFNVWYKNNNSVGNRYIDWKGVWAYRNSEEGAKVLTSDELYDKISYGACEWRLLFDGIHFGLIVGPKTLEAVEECLDILKEDKPPEDDGTKVRHVNSLGGVNWLDKPTFHSWELTAKLGKILSEAFFADRKEKTLYSDEYSYVYKSHSGWSRST